MTNGITYNLLLIPYTWDGANAATYNYLTTSAKTTTGTPACGTYSLPFSESFENAGSIPSCWSTSIVTAASSTQPALTYVTTSTSPSLSTAAAGSYFVKFNSFSADALSQIRLQSPIIDASSATALKLTYSWYNDNNSTYSSNNDNVQLQYTTNGGTSWTNAGSAVSRYNATTGWVSVSVTLPVGALSSTLQIGFLFTSAYGDNCYLDNINLIATPGAPTIGTATVSGVSGTASVPFTAPASNGGSTITSYTATSSPGGITGTLSQSGSGTITVSGLTNGTAYTFTVTATNTAGTSSASAASNSVTPYTVPSAPTIGTASVSGVSGTATVSFTAPANNGSAITTYTATSSPSGITGTLSQAGSGTITVSGLTNGTAYTFTVTATNAAGTSVASSASNSVTPYTVPGAPTIGTAVAGNASATIPFTAPTSNGGSAITTYTATSNPGGITGTLSQAGSGTITVSGLTNGTAYTFTVTATNAAGTSTASAASNSVTPVNANTVPGVPTIGTATVSGVSGTASVSFTAPGSDGGATITTYTATSSPSGIMGTVSQAGSGTITISGLTNGTAYTFTVTATNSVGTSSASSASNSVTPYTVPGAPTVGTATVSGVSGTATVPFTAPASNGGSVITIYTATSSPGGITGTLSQAGSGTITVSGLTNGTAYTFTVTATNAAGTGTASSTSNSVTPYTVPGAPTIGTASVAGVSGTATVSYTAPVSNGGSTITSYTATSSPGGFTGSLSQAGSGTITVSGLTNGTAYTFTVTATNTAGTGAASAASNSVTPYTVPGAPTIGTATAGNGSASVTFTAPTSNGGSTITGYTVTSTPGGFTGTGSVSPITVSGLTNGTAYTFKITATNSAGTSSASAASNSVTPVLTAPVATTATSIGSAGFTANWGAVANASSYALTVYSTSSSNVTNLSENFSGFSTTSTTDVSSSMNTYTQTTGWSGNKIFPNSGYVKIGSSSITGYILTPSLNLSSNSGIATLNFDVADYGDGTTIDVYMSTDGGSTFTTTLASAISISTGSLVTKTVNITGANSTTVIEITATYSGGYRFYLDNVIITQSSTTNNYVSGYNPLNVGNVTSYAVTGLSGSTAYNYYVNAVSSGSTSSNSNVVAVTTTAPIFYLKASSDPSVTSNWGTNTNGSGSNPSAMNISNAVWYVTQNGSTPTTNWTNAWTLGSGATINVTGSTTFNIAGTLTMGGSQIIAQGASATINATSNGYIYTSNTAGFSGTTSTTVSSTNSPTVTLNAASTVEYNGTSAQTVTTAFAYGNLKFTGTGGVYTIGTALGTSTASPFTLATGTVSITNGTFNLDPASNVISYISVGSINISGGVMDALSTSSTGPSTYLLINNSWNQSGGVLQYTGSQYGSLIFTGGGNTSYSGLTSNTNFIYWTVQVSNNTTLKLSSNLAANGFLTSTTVFTVDAGSILDASIYSLSTNKTAGVVAINGTLKTANTNGLYASAGAIASGSLTTPTLGASSTIEYDAPSGSNQTVTPLTTYANLTIGDATTTPSTPAVLGGAVTLSGILTINANASLDVVTSSNYAIALGGNWVNNGVFTPRSGTVTFNGSSALQTIGGTASTAFNNITVNKGTANTNILEATSVITMASGGLTLTNGTFKLSSASTITPFAGGSPTIPSTAGFWNNGGIITAGSSAISWNGYFRATAGTTNIGSNLTGTSTTTYLIDGGTVNVVGRLYNSGSFTMSSGNLTLGTTAPNTVSSPTFEQTVTSSLSISGGTITFQNANTNTGGDLSILNTSGSKSITGGTIVFGNSSTPASSNFKCNASGATLNNVTINSTNTPSVTLTGNTTIAGVLALNGGRLTPSTYTLTINNPLNTAITGGSTTAYINGPVTWTLGTTSTGTYTVPVGTSSNYYPLAFAVATNGIASGNPTITITPNATGAGSADGSTLSSTSGAEYWTVSTTGSTFAATSFSLGRSTPALGNTNAIGKNTSNSGYVSIGGTVGTLSSQPSVNSSSSGLTGASTLYLALAQTQVTVTFNSNGGSSVTAINTGYNTTITLPTAPTLTGYTFGGWYTDNTTFANAFTASTAVTANVTVYAKWTINSYAVTFNSNGGSAVTAINANYNTTITLPTAPTLTGYTFGGWYTDNTTFANAFTASTTVTAAITVYAKWTINSYAVTFTSNGGSAVATQNINYGSTATQPTDPTKAGYTFGGWYTDAGLTSSYSFSTTITGAITLYAKWTGNTYTLTFNGNGNTGGTMASQNFVYGTAANLSANAFTKTGYTLAGWATTSTGTVAYTDAASYSIGVGSTNLYAIWTCNTGTWVGGTSGNEQKWSSITNWCGGVSIPSGSTNVTIPATTYTPVIALVSPVNNLTIATNASLTVTGTLQVAGSISNSGTLDLTGGTLELNGTSDQTISGSLFSSSTIKGLTINNSSTTGAKGVSITGSNLNITDVVTPTTGILTTGGLLTLKSTATATARIAQGAANGGYISGNVTVERYIPAKPGRRWSYVGSAVNTTNYIQGNWQQQVFITGAGTGGTICGSTTGNGVNTTDKYNANGFDVTPTNTPSMYTYNATKTGSSRYTTIANTNALQLTPGTGYRMNIRGDRTTASACADQLVSPAPPTPTAVTLSATGAIKQGTFTIPLNAPSTHLYTLLGNPYASPISFSAFQTDNSNSGVINNKMWTYSPFGNGSYTTYLYSTLNGGQITNAPTNGPGGNIYNNTNGDYIASGGAFFVEAANNTHSSDNVTFNESHKITNAPPGVDFFGVSTSKVVRIAFLPDTGINKLDEVVVNFNVLAIKAYDPNNDAVSFGGGNQQLTALKGNIGLAIGTYPYTTTMGDTVKLGIASTTTGSFRLGFSQLETLDSNIKVTLRDKFLKIETDLRANPTYAFNITSDTGSKGNYRFEFILKPATNLPVTFTSVTAAESNGVATIKWSVANEINISNYVVERSTDGVTYTKVATTNAAGVKNYNANDANLPEVATLYYRVKAVEANGNSIYSKAVKLTTNRSPLTTISIYPNPVATKLNIVVSNPSSNSYTARVLAVSGVEVMRKEGIKLTSNAITMDASKLAAGVYMVELTDEVGNKTMQKFVKE